MHRAQRKQEKHWVVTLNSQEATISFLVLCNQRMISGLTAAGGLDDTKYLSDIISITGAGKKAFLSNYPLGEELEVVMSSYDTEILMASHWEREFPQGVFSLVPLSLGK